MAGSSPAMTCCGGETVIADLLRDRFGLSKNHTLIRAPKDFIKVITDNPFADAAKAERPLAQVIASFPPSQE
jgi:uncharacterized protein (DUF1697 family)